jgi:hypothetical protein
MALNIFSKVARQKRCQQVWENRSGARGGGDRSKTARMGRPDISKYKNEMPLSLHILRAPVSEICQPAETEAFPFRRSVSP